MKINVLDLFIPLNWEEVEPRLYFQFYESPGFLFYFKKKKIQIHSPLKRFWIGGFRVHFYPVAPTMSRLTFNFHVISLKDSILLLLLIHLRLFLSHPSSYAANLFHLMGNKLQTRTLGY